MFSSSTKNKSIRLVESGKVFIEVNEKFQKIVEETKKNTSNSEWVQEYLDSQYYLVMNGIIDSRISDEFIHLASSIRLASRYVNELFTE